MCEGNGVPEMGVDKQILERLTSREWGVYLRAEMVRLLTADSSLLASFILLFGKDDLLTQRLADVFSVYAEINPEVFYKYLPHFSKYLSLQSNFHVSVKRNIVRLVSLLPINEGVAEAFLALCFEYLLDSSEANAVRVFSLTVVYKSVSIYPEIEHELRASIGRILLQKPTKAMLSRIKRYYPTLL